MQRYRYKHGDRPLEGYTIQRAAGHGGFGEVYYALSDSGREVAIKAVQNYEQIELRGISQCMNLKSPHLVTIFDVKYNEHNEPFVIMEFVTGPSLRELLLESPSGLGAQKTAFFLREIAKGLSYLHECGIVHRDLKPSNIFYENGYVKVGDYGLTKAISASRHTGHTITVGTVHYMAPEIGAGNYNYGIDIYALGVLLYEMLTGEVPFIGGSPAEILMKHMTATPELDKIDEPFAHVIKKALAKDPEDRYKSVKEMVEDLFGSENIRNSVSHFSPDELSVVAGRVAEKAKLGEKSDSDKPTMDVTPSVGNDANRQFAGAAQRFAKQADDIGRSVADKFDAKFGRILGAKKTRIPGVTDPILPGQRNMLVFVTMAVVALGAGFLQGNILETALVVFVMTGVCAKTILFSQHKWFGNQEPQSQWLGRLVTCCLASFTATLIGFMFFYFTSIFGFGSEYNLFEFEKDVRLPFPFVNFLFKIGSFHSFTSTWFSLAVPMLLVDWRRISSPDREKRLSLGSALWLGLLGAIAAKIFGSPPIIIAAVLAGTSLVVQTASSFGRAMVDVPAGRGHTKRKDTQFHQSTTAGLVPESMRRVWMTASLVTLALGLFLLIYSGTELGGDDFAIGVAAGVDCLILSVFFFIGSCRRKFAGWYRYLTKPVILLVCVLTIVTSAICMGNMNLKNEEFAISLFFLIFPAMAFFVIAVIPARAIVGRAPGIAPPPLPPPPPPPAQPITGVSAFKRLVALLLSAGGLFGIFGLHRFYVGKIGTGIIWFLTGGLLMIGQIIDVVMILTGQFKDRYGLPLLIWQDKEELKADKSLAKPAVQSPAFEPKAVAVERQAQKAQPALAAEAPKQPAASVPRTTVIYHSFHPFAFLCSGIGFILIFVAIVVGLVEGLHIPYFVAAGWPNPDLAQELEQLFGYKQWPELLMHLGMNLSIILLLFASVFIILGRRHLGARHLIRALLGLLGLILAISAFSEAISGRYSREVIEMLNNRQIGPAFERLLQCWQNEQAFIAGILFLVSVVILAWPPRRRQTVMTDMPNQGVIR
jgi:hypothetical protein